MVLDQLPHHLYIISMTCTSNVQHVHITTTFAHRAAGTAAKHMLLAMQLTMK